LDLLYIILEVGKNLKHLIKFWLPPLVWGIAIFSVSANTVAKVSPIYWQDFVAHKSGHIIEYSLLGILIYRALINEGVKKGEAILYAVLLCGFYGTTDEFHQSFTPGREPRVRDVLIDTIGALSGILIVWKLLPRAPKKLLHWAKRLDLL